MTTTTVNAYRMTGLDPTDALFHRCLKTTSIVGAVFALAMLVVPVRKAVITDITQLSPRVARLIVEPRKPVAPPAPAGVIETPAQSPKAIPGAPEGGGGGGGGGDGGPKPQLIRPEIAPGTPAPPSGRVAPDAGVAGRARAQTEVRAALATSTKEISRTLAGLSTSLSLTPSSSMPVSRSGRGRGPRAARVETELGHASTGLTGGGGTAELGNSVVVGSLVALSDLAPGGHSSGSGGGSGGGAGGGLGSGSGPGVGPGSGGGTGGGDGGGVGTGSGGGVGPGSGGGGRRGAYAPGVYRSNASLLAVIQKYSAGIQYCYGTELKRDPTLRGKLVVALTVAASGEVIEATIVQNSVGSTRLAACALSQMKEWRFPAIPEGVTAFQAPFVFTPPS